MTLPRDNYGALTLMRLMPAFNLKKTEVRRYKQSSYQSSSFAMRGILMEIFLMQEDNFKFSFCLGKTSFHNMLYFSSADINWDGKTASTMPKIILNDIRDRCSTSQKLSGNFARGNIRKTYYDTIDELAKDLSIYTRKNLNPKNGWWYPTGKTICPSKQEIEKTFQSFQKNIKSLA